MRIEFEKYAIESDAHNWTIYERRTAKESGKEYEPPLGYYSSLGGALRGMLNEELATDAEVVPIQEVIRRIDEVAATLYAFGNRVVPKKRPEVVRGDDDEDGDEREGNDNLYLLPGKAKDIIPDLKVIAEKSKGRGVTLTCEIEDVQGTVQVVREKMKGADRALKAVCAKILTTLGE
jgi:hypothetical protein